MTECLQNCRFYRTIISNYHYNLQIFSYEAQELFELIIFKKIMFDISRNFEKECYVLHKHIKTITIY